jgi:hypothetical protein
MSAKKTARGGTKATTIVADDPGVSKGSLRRIGGSQSDTWNNILANQAIQTLWLNRKGLEAIPLENLKLGRHVCGESDRGGHLSSQHRAVLEPFTAPSMANPCLFLSS